MDICLWDKCNNRCLMCTNPDIPWPAWDGSYDYDYEIIIERFEKAKDKIELDEVIYLSGGEPTLHPRFLDILQYLSQHFPKQRIKLLSNGRRFIYKDFTKKVLETNSNFEIDLSIHGPNGDVHDTITRTENSFAQSINGLTNLLFYKKNSQAINIRFVITKLSYKYISQFLKLIKKRFPSVDSLIFIFWEAENQAVKNLETVKVNYRQVKPFIEEICPLLKKFKKVRLYHFPLCTISRKLWPFVWRTLPVDEVAFVSLCSQCKYREHCLGIPKSYLKKVGSHKEFKPIKEDFIIQKTSHFYRPILEVKKR